MSAFCGGRSGLGYSFWSWSLSSIRYGPPFFSGHHIDAVSTALAILMVFIDFRTWWPRPIRGGVGQDAWLMGMVTWPWVARVIEWVREAVVVERRWMS